MCWADKLFQEHGITVTGVPQSDGLCPVKRRAYAWAAVQPLVGARTRSN